MHEPPRLIDGVESTEQYSYEHSKLQDKDLHKDNIAMIITEERIKKIHTINETIGRRPA